MRFYISVTHEEFEQLFRLAREERRWPREQAAVLIAEGLREAERRAARRQTRSKKEATYAAA